MAAVDHLDVSVLAVVATLVAFGAAAFQVTRSLPGGFGSDPVVVAAVLVVLALVAVSVAATLHRWNRE